ncbi:hypothetical protein [Zobellia laminariae]|uniref:hypothetical protein n=1 Tax=Zobellia laminariae TaxID=248906 RepID=UPI0026F422EF|nr:hypothetical protein [Zobellia laminariae]WKX74681.1 hypothetical protein Q5W13_12765 [Zobellia laminariae]
MNKREFLKSAAAVSSFALLPNAAWAFQKGKKLRTAHIGVGNMGAEDLSAISSHSAVDVVALCDVDSVNLSKAHKHTREQECSLIIAPCLMKWEMK